MPQSTTFSVRKLLSMDFVNLYRREVKRSNKPLFMDLLRGGLITILLSSCASVPSTPPTVETIDPAGQAGTGAPEETEEGVITHTLEKDDPITSADDPQTLVDRAREAPPEEAVGLLTLAISGFIESKQYETAQIVAYQLSLYPLTFAERISLQLLHIELTQAKGQHNRAMVTLNQLDVLFIQNAGDPELTPLRIKYLSLLARSHRELGQVQEAIQTLLFRDTLLEPDAQTGNQQRIVSLLLSLDDSSLEMLAQNTTELHLPGWIALTQLLSTSDQEELPGKLQQWRASFPGHPMKFALLRQYLNVGQLESYRQIALLLPLNSPFGAAARAFYDGFIAARNETPEIDQPEILLYDIGEEPELSTFYYQAAINEGADFVVGPLGRQAVNSWLATEIAVVPTLVISNIPEDHAKVDLFGISLSPEQEAAKIAEKAYADGHRQALVFRVDSQWGQRVADAFVMAWEKRGGKIIRNSSFPTDISDYSRIIQKLLSLDKSIIRQKQLSARLGFNLHFTPSRDDVDFLFLAANAKQARLVIPQLRFFQAHNLPMYATSYIYSGEPNASVDADLDGVTLGEMPWMLQGVEQHRADIARRESEKQAAILEENTATEETNTVEDDGPFVATDGTPLDDNSVAIDDPVDGGIPETVDAQNVHQLVTLEETGETAQASSAHAYSALDRLYALGFESYKVIPKLRLMKENEWIRHRGRTMKISVDQHGNVEQHPIWVTFNQGLLEPVQITEN
ncbi:MAG: ABC transporter substrate-binding protein [Gammaproteobacteria bacterium]|nr:ABC transporter substrate-binding protein [Gammaproteobacteria bacterium]